MDGEEQEYAKLGWHLLAVHVCWSQNLLKVTEMSWEGQGTKDYYVGTQLKDNRLQVFTTASDAPQIVLAPKGLDDAVLISDLRLWPSNLLDSQLQQLFQCSSACASDKCTGPSAEDCESLKEQHQHCDTYSESDKVCKTCVEGYTIRDNKCVPCYYNYKTCSSYKKYEALECNDHFYLFQGDCVAECTKGYYRNTASWKCSPCADDLTNEDCVDFMSTKVAGDLSGAKFTPSSFMLSANDMYIWDMNTRQLRVIDLTLQDDKYVEQYAGEYTVYSKDKMPKQLSGNEKYVWILGDKVRQHSHYLQYIDYLQTLLEKEQCTTTQVASCQDFTATTCVGDSETYVMVWDNFQPAFGNLYA